MRALCDALAARGAQVVSATVFDRTGLKAGAIMKPEAFAALPHTTFINVHNAASCITHNSYTLDKVRGRTCPDGLQASSA